MNRQTENFSRQERAIKRFLRDYLDKPKDGETFHSILARVGGYYEADRSYFFELNAERTYVSSTCEWCHDGVSPEIGNLQKIPAADLDYWFEKFEEAGEFNISSLSEANGPDVKTCRMLELMKIGKVSVVQEDTFDDILITSNVA